MTDLIDILRENCTGDCVKVSRIAIIPCFICDAAAEIELLHKALALAVGELSTHAPYEDSSPENLLEFFKEAASHD